MHSIRHIAQSMIEAKLFLQLSFIAFRPPCQCAYLFLQSKKRGTKTVLRLSLCSFLKLALKPYRTDIYRAVQTSALRFLENPVSRTKIFVCADELHEYFV